MILVVTQEIFFNEIWLLREYLIQIIIKFTSLSLSHFDDMIIMEDMIDSFHKDLCVFIRVLSFNGLFFIVSNHFLMNYAFKPHVIFFIIK